MKRNGIRLLNLLLVLAMIAGLLPGMSVTAIAEENEPCETINLSAIYSEGLSPSSEKKTVSGLNAEVEGYAWDNEGWLIGVFEKNSYDLTVRTKSRKDIIVKVVLQIEEDGDSFGGISSSTV